MTLADLYDPLAMPAALVKAYADLDRAVDLCYRPQPFQNHRQRLKQFFALYEKLMAPLLPRGKKTAAKSAIKLGQCHQPAGLLSLQGSIRLTDSWRKFL